MSQERREGEGVQASRRIKVSQRLAEWRSDEASSERWRGATQLVCARVSSVPTDNLLIIDSGKRQLHVIVGQFAAADTIAGGTFPHGAAHRGVLSMDVEGGGPVAGLPMRLSVDALSDLVLLSSEQSAPVVILTGVESAATAAMLSTPSHWS
ncbi:MAG: hypothetical protein M3410_09385 [Acidobacteriota bacterium]|nr:hypothetical protein [Acidobacteriota bacterium]